MIVSLVEAEDEYNLYETESRTVYEYDTGSFRFEDIDRDPDYWGNDDDCDHQPAERSPVAEDTFNESYKDWLRSQDVEEGLLVW
jgi:hypothetical protein